MTNIPVTRTEPGHATVHMPSNLDPYTAPDVRNAFIALVNEETRYHLVADLTDVTFCDSTGLGVLVGALKRTQLHDGEVVLHNPSVRLANTLRVTGLTKTFEITYPDSVSADGAR